MGNSTVLAAAVATCRALGVRMYADAVINHMVGGGNDANPNHRDGNCNGWTQKNTSALVWADSAVSDEGVSPCYTQDFCYMPNANTNLPPSQEFPAVPYGPSDFHCERALNSWTDPLDLNGADAWCCKRGQLATV
jgi:alpha-amylase